MNTQFLLTTCFTYISLFQQDNNNVKKIKLSLCTPWRYMRTYRPYLTLDGGKWSVSHISHITRHLHDKHLGNHWTGRWFGPSNKNFGVCIKLKQMQFQFHLACVANTTFQSDWSIYMFTDGKRCILNVNLKQTLNKVQIISTYNCSHITCPSTQKNFYENCQKWWKYQQMSGS
jgi:hypothetical protein